MATKEARTQRERQQQREASAQLLTAFQPHHPQDLTSCRSTPTFHASLPIEHASYPMVVRSATADYQNVSIDPMGMMFSSSAYSETPQQTPMFQKEQQPPHWDPSQQDFGFGEQFPLTQSEVAANTPGFGEGDGFLPEEERSTLPETSFFPRDSGEDAINESGSCFM